MNIVEVIEQLNKLRAKHGDDIDIKVYDRWGQGWEVVSDFEFFKPTAYQRAYIRIE